MGRASEGQRQRAPHEGGDLKSSAAAAAANTPLGEPEGPLQCLRFPFPYYSRVGSLSLGEVGGLKWTFSRVEPLPWCLGP